MAIFLADMPPLPPRPPKQHAQISWLAKGGRFYLFSLSRRSRDETSFGSCSCRKPAVNRQLWATANGGRHKAMRPGRGVAEWHMLPSWNSLHTLLVARAVLLWHGASYPVLRCSSLARHPDLGPPTVPCARRPLFWYPIPVRIGSPTGDAWLTCQCASQSACSAFHNIRRLSLPSLAGEGTSHCAICCGGRRVYPWASAPLTMSGPS